ncbi:MAG: type III pantothenate kinase [Peptococcaceae bacterium]|jgi:type III pantothenate kinase|nr:type III pantothenate kinase [Peptococcaceae bacterium]
MLLVFDVGNTNIVMGVYDGDELIHSWRLFTDRNQMADEYEIKIRAFLEYAHIAIGDIHDVIISSVVPPIMPTMERLVWKCFHIEPIIVEPGIKTGLSILYENPREVGADRIVNAVAGYALYGGPLIIIDFGTATTFCVVDGEGRYIGGAISPGIGISAEALFQRAAKLPRIELVKPRQVIGRNTVAGMQSGMIFGYVGLVDGIVTRMIREIGVKPKVIATGGMAEIIAEESETIDMVDQDLTLEGLRIIYQRNQKERKQA